MNSPQRPVLVEVARHPAHVTFTARLASGRLVPYFIERPAWVQPGQDLEDSAAPAMLEVWSSNPRSPQDGEAPRRLAAFHVHPDTLEGAAALAALGFTPTLARLPQHRA